MSSQKSKLIDKYKNIPQEEIINKLTSEYIKLLKENNYIRIIRKSFIELNQKGYNLDINIKYNSKSSKEIEEILLYLEFTGLDNQKIKDILKNAKEKSNIDINDIDKEFAKAIIDEQFNKVLKKKGIMPLEYYDAILADSADDDKMIYYQIQERIIKYEEIKKEYDNALKYILKESKRSR